MIVKITQLNYQSAVIQVLLSDQTRFFTASEIAEIITEKSQGPSPRETINGHRRAVVRVLNQLHAIPLIVKAIERRHLKCIPTHVYKYITNHYD